jgi:ribose transport system substrate-binding protein
MNHNIFESFINTVVMGHTHYPFQVCNNDRIHYINTGFMCPPNPNIRTPITYGIYNLSNKKVCLLKVIGNTPESIQPYMNTNAGRTLNYKKMEEERKFFSLQSVNEYENTNEENYDDTIDDEYKLQTKYNNEIDFITINEIKNDLQDITSKIEKKENIIPIQKFTFGWSVFNASLEFWMEMQSGVLSKAEELGIDVLTNDEKSNTIEMITGSIDLISQGINALIIAPFNPELLPAIVANAQKYQVPVVAIDTGTGGADVAAFIVSDSFGGGIYAGEYALILIRKYSIISKNIVIIKVQKTAPYALLRGEGFKSVMLAKGYIVVAEPTANSEESEAYEEMKRILATYANDLAVVFCENGTMSLGAARAIDEAGKKGIIMLIGFDATPSELTAIKNGSMQGTIAQQPFRMGEIGVEIANSVLLGIPVTFDDPSIKLILMEVYLVDEYGNIKRNIP